jgi:hypothetical protein
MFSGEETFRKTVSFKATQARMAPPDPAVTNALITLLCMILSLPPFIG